ncbi:MAG TPA: glycosyltransferase family 87 protein [Rhizomicrobium sp.]|nr:glycosyltransferase family 87 protein [Rhizomicrobium sp.]
MVIPNEEPTAKGSSARRLIFIALIGLTLGAYGVFVTVAALNTHNRIGIGGTPLFYDFSVFHQAGILANAGHAADAYDDGRMIAAQHAAFPGNTMRLPWNYPPTFQLMLMPFGALPYVAAWLIWSCLLYGCYALLVWRLVADPRHRCFLLLAPGVAANLFVGQNGILSIVLMGGGVVLLGSRPILAGILLGLMAYKPQLALLAPLVLICGREWRALAAAVVSQIALMGLSLAVMGMGPWIGFLHKVTHPAVILSSSSDWRTVPSIMTFARTIGLDGQSSMIFHWSIAALAAGAAMWTWWRTKDGLTRLGILAAATLLVAPYLRAYDLALAVLSIAALLARAQPMILEKAIIFVAWLLPAYLIFVPPQIQFGALVSAALLVTFLRYAFSKEVGTKRVVR